MKRLTLRKVGRYLKVRTNNVAQQPDIEPSDLKEGCGYGGRIAFSP